MDITAIIMELNRASDSSEAKDKSCPSQWKIASAIYSVKYSRVPTSGVGFSLAWHLDYAHRPLPRQPRSTSSCSTSENPTTPPLTKLYQRCMYAAIVLRHRSDILKIQQQLRDMALDPRAFPGGGGGSSPDVSYRSTASAPSLRARESEVVAMGRNTPDNAGGNVKVVVRVRGFLQRGEAHLGRAISITY